MAKAWKKLPISEYYEESDSPYRNQRITFSRDLTTVKAIQQKILGHIERNEPIALQNELENHFIYRALGRVFNEQYNGGHHIRTWKKKYFLVRPVAEALLFEHLFVFRDLLAVLKNKNKELHASFIRGCLSQNDIPKTIFDPLDEALVTALGTEIKKLKEHDPKNQVAQALAMKLESLLAEKPVNAASLIEHLEYKINFIEALHSEDIALANDSNYKKIFVNLAMLLLAFIPNLINLVITSNFLFFKNTRQQESVLKMNKHFANMQTSEEENIPEPEMPYEGLSLERERWERPVLY